MYKWTVRSDNFFDLADYFCELHKRCSECQFYGRTCPTEFQGSEKEAFDSFSKEMNIEEE